MADSPVQVAERARRELVEITGLQPEGVTSLERHDDGMWKVTVELLEFSRIPNTDDVLGTYEASLDASGELLGYRRVRRYTRSRSLQNNGSW
jgi:Gas vesicle synthesis protein GvpO